MSGQRSSGRRQFAGRGRSGRPLRPMEWTGAFSIVETVVAAGVEADGLLATPEDLADFTSPTLVRTRGELEVWPADESNAGETAHAFGAYGLVVVDMDRAGVVLPQLDPLEELDYDWFYHTFWSITGHGVGTTELGFASFFRHTIDSKAMRKVEQGEGIIEVFANAPNSEFSIQWWSGMRFLFKE